MIPILLSGGYTVPLYQQPHHAVIFRQLCFQYIKLQTIALLGNNIAPNP